MRAYFDHLLVTVTKVPLFTVFPLTCWNSKIKQCALGSAMVLPKSHQVWGFQESHGSIRVPNSSKTKSHRKKIYLYLLSWFSTVKYRMDFCNVICKNFRMLKDKINLYTGFSQYDLEGKWVYTLSVLILSSLEIFIDRELVGFWHGLYRLNQGRGILLSPVTWSKLVFSKDSPSL